MDFHNSRCTDSATNIDWYHVLQLFASRHEILWDGIILKRRAVQNRIAVYYLEDWISLRRHCVPNSLAAPTEWLAMSTANISNSRHDFNHGIVFSGTRHQNIDYAVLSMEAKSTSGFSVFIILIAATEQLTLTHTTQTIGYSRSGFSKFIIEAGTNQTPVHSFGLRKMGYSEKAPALYRDSTSIQDRVPVYIRYNYRNGPCQLSFLQRWTKYNSVIRHLAFPDTTSRGTWMSCRAHYASRFIVQKGVASSIVVRNMGCQRRWD